MLMIVTIKYRHIIRAEFYSICIDAENLDLFHFITLFFFIYAYVHFEYIIFIVSLRQYNNSL